MYKGFAPSFWSSLSFTDCGNHRQVFCPCCCFVVIYSYCLNILLEGHHQILTYKSSNKINPHKIPQINYLLYMHHYPH